MILTMIDSVVCRQAGWCSSARGLVAFLSLQRVLPLRVMFARCILGKLWTCEKDFYFESSASRRNIHADLVPVG
jgi:hypothetical protein